MPYDRSLSATKATVSPPFGVMVGARHRIGGQDTALGGRRCLAPRYGRGAPPCIQTAGGTGGIWGLVDETPAR